MRGFFLLGLLVLPLNHFRAYPFARPPYRVTGLGRKPAFAFSRCLEYLIFLPPALVPFFEKQKQKNQKIKNKK